MRKYLEYLRESQIISDYHWTTNGLQIITSNIDGFVEHLPVSPWHPLDIRYYGSSFVIEWFDLFMDGYIDFELTDIFPRQNVR